MWLHRNLISCLLLFLTISCLNIANGDEVNEVNITGRWQKIFTEINNTTSTITHQRKITYGWRTNERQENIITIKHGVSSSVNRQFQVGNLLEVFSLSVGYSVGYSYEHSSERRMLTEYEIHRTEELTITYNIQPWSQITRWQFIADVLGNEYRFRDTLSVMDNQIPKSYVVTAQVRRRREIRYGITPIRIKHKKLNKYITLVTRKNWPAATLGDSSWFYFILYDVPELGAKRIRALNTMYSGHEWLYSSSQGGIYFDLDHNSDYYNAKQYWYISKAGVLYDGDVVTFRNRYYDDSYMCYHEGPATDVYCLQMKEDEWILEVV